MKTAQEFPAFLSQVFDVTQCDSIIGFQATMNNKINSHLNILQSLTILPRIYPIGLIRHSGEMKLPGNYQLNLNGDVSGLPFAVAFSKNSVPSASLTIPLSDSSVMNVSGALCMTPVLGSSFSYIGNKFTSRVDIDLSNCLKNCSFTFFSTFFPSPKYGIGASLMYPLSEGSSMLTVAATRYFDKQKICAMLHISEHSSFAVGATHTIEPNTVAGVTIKVDQDPIQSEFRLGVQKNFLMSRVSSVVSTSGIVQSFYQRNVKQGIMFSASMCADHNHKVYSLGCGIVLET